MQERWLSVDEIASHLFVNPETIYKWIERKRLPTQEVGRCWKLLAPEVEESVKGGKLAQGAELPDQEPAQVRPKKHSKS